MTTGRGVIMAVATAFHELTVGQPVMPFDYALPDIGR